MQRPSPISILGLTHGTDDATVFPLASTEDRGQIPPGRDLLFRAKFFLEGVTESKITHATSVYKWGSYRSDHPLFEGLMCLLHYALQQREMAVNALRAHAELITAEQLNKKVLDHYIKAVNALDNMSRYRSPCVRPWLLDYTQMGLLRRLMIVESELLPLYRYNGEDARLPLLGPQPPEDQVAGFKVKMALVASAVSLLWVENAVFADKALNRYARQLRKWILGQHAINRMVHYHMAIVNKQPGMELNIHLFHAWTHKVPKKTVYRVVGEDHAEKFFFEVLRTSVPSTPVAITLETAAAMASWEGVSVKERFKTPKFIRSGKYKVDSKLIQRLYTGWSH